MKRWIDFAASLYPRKWRERYGAEFHALLAEVNPGWRELLNVFAGALKMQLTTRSIYLKFSLAAAVFGAIAATAASFAVPKVYISSSVLRLSGASNTEGGAGLDEQFSMATQDVMSRPSLAELMQRPALNLYPKERQTVPLEDVVETMRRDVCINRVSSESSGLMFRIQSAYPDQRKAQAVTTILTGRIVESFSARRAKAVKTNATFRSRENLEIVEPPTLPDHGVGPQRPVYAAVGLGIGLLLGLVAAFYMQHRRRTLLIVGCGLAGLILGGTVSFLVPNRYIATAVIRLLPSTKLTDGEAAAWTRSTVARVQSEPAISAIMKRNRENEIQLHGKAGKLPRAALVSIFVASQDPYQAQRMVQQVAAQFRNSEDRDFAGQLEFLDPPSFPQSPMGPNRLVISLLGLAAGLAIGTGLLWFTMRRNTGGSLFQSPISSVD